METNILILAACRVFLSAEHTTGKGEQRAKAGGSVGMLMLPFCTCPLHRTKGRENDIWVPVNGQLFCSRLISPLLGLMDDRLKAFLLVSTADCVEKEQAHPALACLPSRISTLGSLEGGRAGISGLTGTQAPRSQLGLSLLLCRAQGPPLPAARPAHARPRWATRGRRGLGPSPRASWPQPWPWPAPPRAAPTHPPRALR